MKSDSRNFHHVTVIQWSLPHAMRPCMSGMETNTAKEGMGSLGALSLAITFAAYTKRADPRRRQVNTASLKDHSGGIGPRAAA